MGHFYFIRHGQSVWNVENKICGATDIALTEKGHEQAVETGKKFIEQGLHADMILYSPLVRAAETACHISEMTGIPMREEERLREQNFGKYEGTARNGAEFKEAKKQLGHFFCTGTGGPMRLSVNMAIGRYDALVAFSGSDNVTHDVVLRGEERVFTLRFSNVQGSRFHLDGKSILLADVQVRPM